MKIGFIGVGNMGGPMCRNIIKGGFDVTVFDLNADAVARCVEAGGSAGASLAETVAGKDVVMTSLPMPDDVDAVALAEDGIAGAAAGTIYVDLSTNAPSAIRRVAEALSPNGIVTLDAPVSGGVAGAEKASIAIMVGGDAAAFATCRPIFEAFGKTIVHVGGTGSGCVAKLINNMMAFANMATAAEGMILGAAAGIDHDTLVDVIDNSSGASFVLKGLSRRAKANDWSPAFALELANKDMRLALQLANELEVPMRMAPVAQATLRMARAMGFAADDTTGLMRVLEATSGLSVRDD